MQGETTLYTQARQMVADRGGLTPTMTHRLMDAGYTPEFLKAVVAIWRRTN